MYLILKKIKYYSLFFPLTLKGSFKINDKYGLTVTEPIFKLFQLHQFHDKGNRLSLCFHWQYFDLALDIWFMNEIKCEGRGFLT